jgi:hypothetical protein
MIRHSQHHGLSKISQRQSKRLHDTHRPGRVLVEMVPYGTLQHRHIDRPVRAGGTDLFTEMPYGGGGITSAPKTRDSWHAGVVPSGDDILINQLLQLALARDGVAGIEPGKLDLSRLWGTGRFYEPIVKRPMILKLQRADRVGNPLDGVLLSMSKIIGGIDWPL